VLKKLFINALLVAASLLFIILVGEIGMRVYLKVVYEPSAGDPLHDDIELLQDSDRVYALKPTKTNGLNSAGFRGREFSTNKPTGIYRVVMLGDSIIFGTGIGSNETIPYFLEKLLSDTEGTIAYEVYNLGISGYNSSQELATLRELGFSYQPDLVILNICQNDSDPIKEVWKAGLVQRARIRSLRDINLRTILGASYFLTFVKNNLVEVIRKYRPEALETLNSPILFLNSRVTESAWSAMKEDILAIGRESLDDDAQFVAVIYPYRSQIELARKDLVPQNDLLAFLQDHGLLVFDAIEPYQDAEQEMFSDSVLHLSAYGSERVAAKLLEFLMEQEIVPPSGRSVDEVSP